MENSGSRAPTGKFLAEATFLGLASLLAYFYVYCFEFGVSYYFGYPVEIIRLGLESIIHTWLIITFYIIFMFGFFQLNLQYWPATQRHFYGFALIFFAYVAAALFLINFLQYISVFDSQVNAIAFVFLLSSLLAYFSVYIYNRHVQKGGVSADETQENRIFTVFDSKSIVPEHSIGFYLLARLGFDPLAIALVFLLVMPGLSIYAGYADAYAKKQFYVYTTKENEHRIILKINSGNIVEAPYYPEIESYERKFVVKNIIGLEIEGFVPERIQNLKALNVGRN